MIPDSTHRADAITSSKATPDWIPSGNPTAYQIVSRGDTQVSRVLHMKYNETEQFLTVLGPVNGLQVGFNAAELDNLDVVTSQKGPLREIPETVRPKSNGKSLTLGYHGVHIQAEELVRRDVKYYMIDIDVDAIGRPKSSVGDAIIDKTDITIAQTEDPVASLSTQTSRGLRNIVRDIKGLNEVLLRKPH
ncbi:MAG: hypothetical protein Q9165_007751 [Trypethelium subeluteriae]